MPRANNQSNTTPATPAATPTPTPTIATPKIDARITSMYNRHENPLRAVATVVLDDCFVVNGVRVLRGENSLYVKMPARRGKNGEYREMCYPITKEFSKSLNATVLSEYQVQLALQMAESEQVPHLIEPDAELEQQVGPEAEPTMDDPADGMDMEMSM